MLNFSCWSTHYATTFLALTYSARLPTMNANTACSPRPLLPGLLIFLQVFLLGAGISLAGVPQPPSVEMTLSPEEIGVGSSSELTITIDNSANPGPISDIQFTLLMPEGVIVRGPSSECGGTVTIEEDGALLRLTDGEVPSSSSCEITAIVTQSVAGPHLLTIEDFSSNAGESENASVTLRTSSTTPIIGFRKRFVPDLVPLGGRSTLIYTIENQGTEGVLNLSVTDFFPAGIAIATPPSVSTSCPGISITAINGTQAIEVSPDDPIPLPAGATCTLTLDVVGVAPGIHLSVSGNLTAVGEIGGEPASGGLAVAQLEVISPALILDASFTKEFIDDPIAPGGTGTLEFTITNNSTTDSLSNIQFTDDLEATLQGLFATEIPTRGGTLVEADFGGDDDGGGGDGGPIIPEEWEYLDRIENENGANQGYPADGSGNAWNSIDFDVATSNIGPWESEDVPIQVGGVDGFPGAPDLLFGIDAAPNGENLITTYLFRNTFEMTAGQLDEAAWLIEYLIDDGAVVYVNGTEVFRTPSMPAGEVSTTTLSNLGNESGLSTGGVNLNGILVEGTNFIAVEVHQASLTSSDSGFQLQLVPASQNPTGGFTYVDDPFQDQPNPNISSGQLDPNGFSGGGLQVQTGGQGFFAGFSTPESSGGWSRDFTLEEAATATINLRYRLLVDGTFDNSEYGEAVLTVDGTRYGSGAGNSLLRFDGTSDNDDDSDSNWQSATIEVPLAAGTHTLVLGAYINRSTQGSEVVQAWFDDVVIEVPEINIEPCGPGSSIEGSDLLSIAGGTLAPGQSCSFSVEVSVPVSASFGTYLNVTSRLTADIGGESKVALPASDTLVVEPIPPIITKSFNPSAIPVGGRSTVTYTIDNTASALEAGDIAFTDIFPGSLTFDPSSVQTVNCGEGGTYSFLPLTNTFEAGGSALVPAGASCTISFDVIATSPGTYESSTSELTTSLGSSPGAGASLTVVPSPVFTQTFEPKILDAGQAGTLTYTIDNSASILDATTLFFANTLPAGLVLADPIGLFSNCVGGNVTAGSGSSSFSYSDGTVPAGASCILRVNVTSLEGGTFENTTGDLTSSLGNSGNSTDTLVVTPIVRVSLDYNESIDPVLAGSGNNNLVYTISAGNSGPSTATGITITEALAIPPGVRLENIVASDGTYEDGTWDLGTLGAGTSATLTITLTVEPTATAAVDAISSSATLTTVNQTNLAPGTSASAVTSIITRADLQVTNTELTPDPVIAGSGAQNLAYLVSVTNNGPSFASNVVLESVVTRPPGVTFSAAEPSDGTTFSDDVWTVGNLPVGTTAVLQLFLTADSSTAEGTDVIANVASVTSLDQTDVNPQNNTVTTTTSVVREVDLIISIAESRDPVLAGYDLPGNLTHTVLVINNGPSDASNLSVAFDRTTPLGTAQSVWTIGNLVQGESAAFPVVYDIDANVPEGLNNITTLAEFSTVNERLFNLEDDSASERTSVVNPRRVTISAGDIELDLQTALFKQTITITNNNPLAIPAFQLLVGGLPDDVTVHNAQGESNGRSALFYNQSLAPGESVDLVIEYFQADSSGGFEAEFSITLRDATEVATSAEGLSLNRVASLPNEDKLLEFISIVGDTYTIQFSENGKDWINVVPDVIAGANVTQWIDNGPPKTPSHPRTTKSRFYRVVPKAPDSFSNSLTPSSDSLTTPLP